MKDLTDVDPRGDEYGTERYDVEGVVAPGQQYDDDQFLDGFHLHSFGFCAWRKEGGSLEEKDLHLMRAVLKPRWWRRSPDPTIEYPAYSVQRFRVLLSKDETRAVVGEDLGFRETPADLAEAAARLQRPFRVKTKLFGPLTLEREYGCFKGKGVWGGSTIRVTLKPSTPADLAVPLRIAARLWKDQEQWNERVEALAVAKLLPLKNDRWREEGEAELSADALLAKMKLREINVRASGNFEFWYSCGKLFTDHAVEIWGNLDEGLKDADLA